MHISVLLLDGEKKWISAYTGYRFGVTSHYYELGNKNDYNFVSNHIDCAGGCISF